MKRTSTNNGFPAGNPIANLFVILVGALAIAAFVIVGFFAVAIVGTLLLILASIVGIRVWWLKRKLGGQTGPETVAKRTGENGVIEGEYQVVAEDREGE